MRKLFLSCLFLFSVFQVFSSNIDFTTVTNQKVEGDTLEVEALKKPHSPKKAALMSAIFPGLGQIYNHKYWKVPLVYGIFGAAVYMVSYNTSQYNYFRNQYTYLVDYQAGNSDGSKVNPDYLNYNADGLKQQSLQFKRLQELSFVVAGAVYILNIVDASVDAHLFTFDISDDLSMKINPAVVNSFSLNNSLNYSPGFSLKLNFK